jgi:uncharacterized phage protein gp47/JayE
MPDMTTKPFRQIVADQASAAQAAAGRVLDFSIGSLLRAIADATGAVALWLQAEVLKVLAATRLSTSSGTDVDTFVQDFGTSRVGATFASGEVTMARFTTGAAAAIPVGTGLRTYDGQAAFTVRADERYAGWDASLPGYRLAASAASIVVPVVAGTAGTAGNVDAGSVTQLTSPITGIDTVANASAVTGGSDAETDAETKARFPNYIASLSQGTRDAIAYAVSQARPGLSVGFLSGADAAPYNRDFVVVVNDGDAVPSATVINAVASAVEASHAFGVSYGVISATILPASISLTLTTSSGHAAAVAAVAKALEAHLNKLGLGEAMPFSRIAQIAYGAAPAVTNVTGILLNGGTADLLPTKAQVIRPGLIAVS